jgi:hypothetical protein
MGAGAALAIGGVPAAQGAGEPRSTIATESNTAQTSRSGCGYNFFMNPDAIRILTVERDGDDGVIVTFSDGTTGAYVVEELLKLRPKREPTAMPKIPIQTGHFPKLL